VRTKITDAPIFLEAQKEVEQQDHVRYGVFEVLKLPRGVLTAMGLRFAENIMYYLVVTFSITYLKIALEVDTAEILGMLVIAHIVHMIVIPLVGGLADRIGRKPVYTIGVIGAAAWGFIAFPMFNTKDPVIIILAICLGLVIHSFMYAPQPAIMSEMFPTRMRYSGVSLGYQVTSIVAARSRRSSRRLLSAYGRTSRWPSTSPSLRRSRSSPSSRCARRRASLHEVDRVDRERLIAETGTVKVPRSADARSDQTRVDATRHPPSSFRARPQSRVDQSAHATRSGWKKSRTMRARSLSRVKADAARPPGRCCRGTPRRRTRRGSRRCADAPRQHDEGGPEHDLDGAGCHDHPVLIDRDDLGDEVGHLRLELLARPEQVAEAREHHSAGEQPARDRLHDVILSRTAMERSPLRRPAAASTPPWRVDRVDG
jgi:hypothetical protein